LPKLSPQDRAKILEQLWRLEESIGPSDWEKSLLNEAQAAFDNFRRSHRREYVEWITDAKTDQTRARRLKTAVEQMAEGKSQNWKGNTRRKQGPGARGLKAGAGPGSFASGTGGLRRS